MTPMLIGLLILRLIHILGGIFWVGSTLFMTLFLAPALASAGPSAGQIMGAFQRRGLMTILPVTALLTMASGLWLLNITSGNSPAYFATPMGRAFSMGGAAAIVAFFLGLLFVRPGAMRTGRLSAELANADEARRAIIMTELTTLRRRGTIWSMIVITLLLLAAAAMATARYLR